MRWLTVMLKNRRQLSKEAEALIAAHGDQALLIARETAIRTQRTGDWRIVRSIEVHFGINSQKDTATRYFD
jgi:1,2-phenylacetyl-CoA epoxidase PaaB subunit